MIDTGFLTAVRFYARILASVLAVIGFLSVIGWYAGWVIVPKPEPPRAVVPTETLIVETDKPVKAVGSKAMTSQLVPVDPSLTYELSAEVRSVAPPGSGPVAANTYLGVITYDLNGKEIRGGPGTYRYAAASKYPLYSTPSWRTLSGSIAGEGNESHNQFRPGTRFIRVIALLNYGDHGNLVESGMITTEIRNVQFAPRLKANLH